ncbi:MAG: hypothetical protein ABJO57_19635 [Lentilitoribacter sp.]
MPNLEIDLQLPILPEDHSVFMVRPGWRYYLYADFLASEAVAPDFPYLELADKTSPAYIKELQNQLGRGIEFRDWLKTAKDERGFPPSKNIDDYGLNHEDRIRMRNRLQSTAQEVLWDLPDNSLIFIPAKRLDETAMTGELSPKLSPRKLITKKFDDAEIKYLGRSLLGAKRIPMRVFPEDVTDVPKLSGLTTYKFEGYARDRLLRAHYGDYQLGDKISMMEFISGDDRFDARALARLTAISDVLDNFLKTGKVVHPGDFLFSADGISGAEVHARINSKDGRVLVEAYNFTPHLLRALLLIASMANPISAQELINRANSSEIKVSNSAPIHSKYDIVTDATEQSLRNFAREAGVKNLGDILENLRKSSEITKGNITGSAK